MTSARLIKRHEIQNQRTPVHSAPRPAAENTRRAVTQWLRERQTAGRTNAREAFAALFTLPAGQSSF
ncbi:MAG TPA: hypothetical protein VNQ79_13930 [Blastocatellia bacterium]|nr:hypothetical protein [Blastocatellia bacterium]